MEKTPRSDAMGWSGVCTDCGAMYLILPNDERMNAAQIEAFGEEWPESFADCMREDCDGSVEWNGNEFLADIVHPRLFPATGSTEPAEESAGPVHWVGDAPTSLHGNGAASFERTTRERAEVTCPLCLTLLNRGSSEQVSADV